MDNINKPAKDNYLSIEAPSQGLYKELSSKFISFAYPVTSEGEIKSIITDIKKEYFDARHHCYAYRIGYKGDKWRMNDDGEPSSTAGKPILGQILSNELSDILIVVVRYFGGTKLGVPGLIRAYKTASADAIANANIIEKIAKESFAVRFAYDQMNNVMKVFKEFNISPNRQHFDNDCIIEADVRLNETQRFIDALSDFSMIDKIVP